MEFNINNALYRQCYMRAFFYDGQLNSLMDKNNNYKNSEGKVSTGLSFKPGYEKCHYDDLNFFMPYDEFDLPNGSYQLCFQLVATCENSIIGSSSYVNFQYYIPNSLFYHNSNPPLESINAGKKEMCYRCMKSGQCIFCRGMGHYGWRTCVNCKGTGKCSLCNGYGYTMK